MYAKKPNVFNYFNIYHMYNFILLGIKTISKKEKSEPQALCMRWSARHKLIFMFRNFLYQLSGICVESTLSQAS